MAPCGRYANAVAGLPLALATMPRVLTRAPRRRIGISPQWRTSPGATLVALPVVGAALSLLLPSALTYDPTAWAIWGREITQLDLDTVNGPAWKPLPVLVTTVAAPLGDAMPYVWLLIARACAIAACILTYVVADRIAGRTAGVAAAGTLALMPWFVENAALGNSEAVGVTLVLAGVLAHLEGRRGWAFAAGLGSRSCGRRCGRCSASTACGC